MRGPEPFFTEQDCARFERATFDGFPYLIVHPAVGINHIQLLPDTLAPRTLRWVARLQRTANRLPVTLALSPQESVLFPAHGSSFDDSRNLSPGFPVTGAIEPCTQFRETPASKHRIASLDRFIRRNPMRGFRFGDPFKSGRPASIGEAQWLFGRQANGVPAGLRQCSKCEDWMGECLDPVLREAYDEDFMVTVWCRCENWNRCARCHRTFEGRRLNSNYYDPRDGNIWFVPGILALDHRC